MRKTMTVFVVSGLLAAGCGCGGAKQSEANLAERAPAPPFTATDQHGEEVTLAALHADGPLVLTFLRSFW
jgi:cytochrome oxidase Cu insertion factor (SCO1/SenC/PrrC family)